MGLGNHGFLHQPVIPQHNHRKQQFVQAVGLRRLARQQWRGLRVEHHKVGLTAGLQIAHHAAQAQRLRGTGRVLPPQVLR